jgi:hypothetical protein
MSDPKSAHESARRARSRYKIEIPIGKDGVRHFAAEAGTCTGDVVLEYWDGKLIRDHKYVITSCLTQPTASERMHWMLNSQPGDPPLQATMQNTPTFTTTVHDMTNVPSEISLGQWTNPLDDKPYKPPRRCGPWGIYAADYVDVYTRQCIDPLVQRYEDKMQSMRNAITKLKPNEKTITYAGAVDDIAGTETRISAYIRYCDVQIEEATHILGIPRAAEEAARLMSVIQVLENDKTQLTAEVARLKKDSGDTSSTAPTMMQRFKKMISRQRGDLEDADDSRRKVGEMLAQLQELSV